MKSAVLCVCFALIVHRGRATTDEDFKPTPIPLEQWSGAKDGATSALNAAVTPASEELIPPRYWEDALRHSVYLTIVRDKIDQLIAKGGTNPNNLLEGHSNAAEDHNLWEKIKSAPFVRISAEESPILGDITLMAKGRMLDVDDEYQFVDDDIMKEKCDEQCMQGVKALWSVKRVRQKDMETVPGKYHYELTFSVNSVSPKKIKKPFDSSVRTFTVRDGTPVEQPMSFLPRPQRALWLHKNILPIRGKHHVRHSTQSLDRFFLSLFESDEDETPLPRRPHNTYNPPSYSGPKNPNVKAHVAAPTEQYSQKNPHSHPLYKYTRPPLTSPPIVSQAEHHYKDTDKIRVPFAPLPVKYNYPDTSIKLKTTATSTPIEAPPEVQQDKINTIYPHSPVQTHSVVPPIVPVQAMAPIHTENTYSTPIPFYEEVQRYLDEVKAKYPLTPPAVQYHYDTKNKVLPPKDLHHPLEPIRFKPQSYSPASNLKYQSSNIVKTTKTAVLPTPPTEFYNSSTEVMKNLSDTTSMPISEIASQYTTNKPYKKNAVHKPLPLKHNYTGERLRPPVFNSPPGVFMTMEKKPFKPLPPLTYVTTYHTSSKPFKTKPIDFRPSPQVVDIQLFSDPDPLSDAFRPMPTGNPDRTKLNETTAKIHNTKQKFELDDHNESNSTKTSSSYETPQSTAIPEIITAETIRDTEDWAQSLLNAMASHDNESVMNQTDLTTASEPSTTVTEPTPSRTFPTTTVAKKEDVESATTPSPKKRTRPPPKYGKTDKVKKHKRTNTTITTTTTTSTTEKPRHKRPSTQLSDLAPQATSAITGPPNSTWQFSPIATQHNTTMTTAEVVEWEDVHTPRPTSIISLTTTPKSISTTRKQTTTTKQITTPKQTLTTTKPITTTKQTTTTKRATTTAVSETEEVITTPKNKNRFRQSTLFYKGTSVKHDKWSLPVVEKSAPAKSNPIQQRRKGSNFQGYGTSTNSKNVDEEEHHKADHKDLSYNAKDDSTTQKLEVIPVTSDTNDSVENLEIDSTTEPDVSRENSNESSYHDQSDGETVVFYNQRDSTENNNDEIEVHDIDSQNNTTPAAIKKSKCKKKKNQNLTSTEETPTTESTEVVEDINITSEKPITTTDIFAEIFAGFTVEGLPKQTNKTSEHVGAGSEKKEHYAHMSDDLEDFLDSQESKKIENDTSYEYVEEDVDDYSYSNEKRTNRHADIAYDEYRERPYSLLELMAMD